MEKFMFLFKGSDVYEARQAPKALEKLTQKMMEWVKDISDKGMHISSEKLNRTGKQIVGTNETPVDFPFGDEKKVVGGCTIIQAQNMDDAIAIAKRCPILETDATIEIRPIVNM